MGVCGQDYILNIKILCEISNYRVIQRYENIVRDKKGIQTIEQEGRSTVVLCGCSRITCDITFLNYCDDYILLSISSVEYKMRCLLVFTKKY